MLKYTKMSPTAFQELQVNAGILVDGFNPATGEVTGNILGATSGGIQFATNPTYTDYGEDVDNCPPNTKQMKRVSYYDPQMSGTFLTCTPAIAAMFIGAAEVTGIKIVPRAQLLVSDFKDLWWIGDYSDINTGTDAGFLAVHLIDALNTTGFQIQSGKDAKGQMSFEFHGHYDMEDPDQTPPFEIYCKAGETGTEIPSIHLNTNYITVAEEGEVTLTATVKNTATPTVTWSTPNNTYASVDQNGVVTGVSAGSVIVTATITDNGVSYSDTCTVVVTA